MRLAHSDDTYPHQHADSCDELRIRLGSHPEPTTTAVRIRRSSRTTQASTNRAGHDFERADAEAKRKAAPAEDGCRSKNLEKHGRSRTRTYDLTDVNRAL